MLNNRTIPIRSGLLCLAVGARFSPRWLSSRSSLARRRCRHRLPTAAATKGVAQGAARRPGGVPTGQAASGAPAEEPPTEAERAIDEAIRKIAKLQSVAAKLEQDVDMLNQKFKITGRYLKAPNIATSTCCSRSPRGCPIRAGSFLQVCDGETLWEC